MGTDMFGDRDHEEAQLRHCCPTHRRLLNIQQCLHRHRALRRRRFS